MLQKKNSNKKFLFPKTDPICSNMKTITLEKIIRVLETGENSLSVSEEIVEKAGVPLKRMLELGKQV